MMARPREDDRFLLVRLDRHFFLLSNQIQGGHTMKKVFALMTAFLILLSSFVYAGGDKNRGSEGQGSTGTNGGGTTTQTRGN